MLRKPPASETSKKPFQVQRARQQLRQASVTVTPIAILKKKLRQASVTMTPIALLMITLWQWHCAQWALNVCLETHAQ